MAERRIAIPGLLITLLACGCGKVQAPSFAPGTYTPDPSAYVNVTTASATEILAGTKTSVAMFEPERELLLYGNALLSVSADGLLMVNMRDPGNPDRSPCSFWFHAAIDTAAWQISPAPMFQLRLEPGQYVVEENCASPFDDSIPLIVTFTAVEDGQKFMNLMAALEQRPG